MYETAQQVLDWRRAGRAVLLIRVLDVRGMSSRWPAAAVAVARGEPPAGSVLAGAADDQLAELAAAWHAAPQQGGRVVELTVGAAAAAAAGLSCGGHARLLLEDAGDVDDAAWHALADRQPVALVTDISDPAAARTLTVTADGSTPGTLDDDLVATARRMLAAGTTDTVVAELADGRQVAITAHSPTPRLVVVGAGLLADALRAQAGLLGWDPTVTEDVDAATAAVRALTSGDGVVVLSHDRAVDGPALAAALAGRAGYVGALGSRRTQAARTRWLADHGVAADEIARVRGPAGLDIGSRTPAEIALAIAAEMLAARSGSSGAPLRDRATTPTP
jgi:xanthine dehydrogenase accessory factor